MKEKRGSMVLFNYLFKKTENNFKKTNKQKPFYLETIVSILSFISLFKEQKKILKILPDKHQCIWTTLIISLCVYSTNTMCKEYFILPNSGDLEPEACQLLLASPQKSSVANFFF